MTSSAVGVKPTLDVMGPVRLLQRGWRIYQFTREVKRRAAEFGEGPERLHQQAELLKEICARLMDSHGMQMVVRGSSLPEPPFIMVCNHLGYMDPIILAAIQASAPIAKRELGDWPVIGPTLDSLGVMLVHRGNLHQSATVLRRALRALRAGVAVVNFPEGTTTSGDRMLPFKRGVFGLAKIANVPVVPSRMDFLDPSDCWIGDDGFLEHYLKFGAMTYHGVRLRISDPIDPNDYPSAQAMADAVREHIGTLVT